MGAQGQGARSTASRVPVSGKRKSGADAQKARLPHLRKPASPLKSDESPLTWISSARCRMIRRRREGEREREANQHDPQARHRRELAEPSPEPKELIHREERMALRAELGLPPD